MSEAKTAVITCPCCQAALEVDLAAGVVVGSKKVEKKGPSIDLDARVAAIETERARAKEKMDEAFRAESDRERLLAARFDSLLANAKDLDDGEAPIRDIDLD